MRARVVVMGLIIPAAVLLTSCGKREDKPLAEFADRKITIGEFELAYANVSPEFLPEADGLEGRREFLTTMLNKEVMACKADELGYDKDPGVVKTMETFKKSGLQAGYLKRRIADQITVSEDEVREHYRNRGASVSVKQILVDTPYEAEDVVALLDTGADFESVCKKLSKGEDASVGGSVMTVNYGRYSPDLQKAVFSKGVGEYTEPVLTAYGFFIIKVVSRTDARTKEPYDDIHDTLEQEVRVIKETLETNRHTEELRNDYGVEWYWEGLDICFRALPEDRSFDQAPARKDEVYPLLYFDPQDLDKPVVSYGEKMILVKDFSDYYDQSSFYARSRKNFRVGGIRAFLVERIMSDLVQREIKRSRIEEDPEVKSAMDAKREEIMISRLWDDMVNQQTTVTNSMINEYYQENISNFDIPERRRFGVIVTSDIATAQRAYDELQSGTLFRTVTMAYSIDDKSRETLGETELLAEGEQPEMDTVGFALPGVGSYSEPFQTSRGWMILKVTELESGGRYSLEQARPVIEGALKEQLNEERLNGMLAKWTEELNVIIHEDNLEKVQIEERVGKAKTSS